MAGNNGHHSNRSRSSGNQGKRVAVRNSQQQPPAVHTRGHVVQQSWSAPLPPPSILDGYSNSVQNGAERLFALVEEQEQHRRGWEIREQANRLAEVKLKERNEMTSRFLGATLIGSCVVIAAAVVFTGGKWEAASMFLSLPLLSVIKEVISGRKSEKNKQDLPGDDTK